MSLLLTESFDQATGGTIKPYYDGKFGRMVTGLTGLQGGNIYGGSSVAGRHARALQLNGDHTNGVIGGLSMIWDEGTDNNTVCLGHAVQTFIPNFIWGTAYCQIIVGEQRLGNILNHVTLDILGATVTVRHGSGTSLGTFTMALSTWYFLELRVVVHDTTGMVDVRLDGLSVFSYTGDTRNGGTGLISCCQWWANSGGGSGSTRAMMLDDLYVCNGTGPAPYNGAFLGDVTVEYTQPSSNNVPISWAVTGAASNWDAVADSTTSGAPVTSDYVSVNATDAEDRYDIPNTAATAPSEILAVCVYPYAEKIDSGARTLAATVTQGGTTAQSQDFGLKYPATGGPFYQRYCLTTAPDGTPWTIAKRNATAVGIKARP